MAVVGSNQVILLEPELFHVARLDGYVPKGITGTLANGSGAGFRRQLGITSFVETIPEDEIRAVQGDGGTIAQYKRNSVEPISIASAVAVFDQTTVAELTDKTIYTEGAWEISQRSRRCRSFKDIGLIVSGRVISQESGSVGQKGWYTIFIWNAQAEETGFNLAIATETPVNMSISPTETDKTWWEELFTTNYGQTYAWASDPVIADYPLMVHTYIGDGNASQDFVLDYTPSAASANAVQIWSDGTKQTYTTDYTVTPATKTVAYTVAGDPAAATDNVVVYEYVAPC